MSRFDSAVRIMDTIFPNRYYFFEAAEQAPLLGRMDRAICSKKSLRQLLSASSSALEV